MKRKYLLTLSVVVLLAAACGSKKKESSAEGALKADSVSNSEKMESTASAEKQAKDKAREERKKLRGERHSSETYDLSGTTVYTRTAVKPEYKGGKDAMNKYFRDNLKYPEGSQWQGTIVVDFVIGKDGKVVFADVSEDPDSVSDQSCREEALRVVKAMPAWTPGKQGGKQVAASYSLPVTFQQQ